MFRKLEGCSATSPRWKFFLSVWGVGTSSSPHVMMVFLLVYAVGLNTDTTLISKVHVLNLDCLPVTIVLFFFFFSCRYSIVSIRQLKNLLDMEIQLEKPRALWFQKY